MAKKVTVIASPNLQTPLSTTLIGGAVRARRTQCQLRVDDAAALCGVAKQTFMKVEHGHPNTQIATVLRICASLGINISILPWLEDSEVNHEWL